MADESNSMKPDEDNERSPFAMAMEWTSRITAISLEMVLPPLLGLWLDQRWQTRPWLLILGAILGFCTGMMSLLQLGKQERKPKP